MATVAPAVAGASSSKSTRVFPEQLHYVLAELERDGESHIASWQPHGRSFRVHNRDEFVKKILPIWFRQHNFASFQRQLNIYGFSRICSGPEKESYYHEHFLRGQPQILRLIPRMAVKGQGPRRPVESFDVPNFYQMVQMPPSNHGVLVATSSASSAQENCPVVMGSTGIANEAVAISNPSATSREIESRKAAMPVGRGTSLQASLDVERAAETTRHSVSTVQPDMAGHAALATQQQSNNIPTSSQPLTDLSLLQLLWLQRQQQAQQHEVHQNDLLLAGPRNNSLRIQSFAEEAQLQALVTAQAHLREQQQCAQLDALRHHLAVPNQGMQPPMLLQMPTHSILAAATLPPPLLQQPPQVVLPLSEYLAYLELVRRGSNP